MSLGDIVVGVCVAALGLLGLVMASRALDQEIYVFGLSLFGFAVAFDWALMVRGLKAAEARRAGTIPNGAGRGSAMQGGAGNHG